MGFTNIFKRDQESRSRSPKRSSKSDQSLRRASTASNEQQSTRSAKDGSSKSGQSRRQLPAPKAPPALKTPPAARLSSNKSSSTANSSVKHVEETRGRPSKREVEEGWNEIRAPVEGEGSPVMTNGDHPPDIDERQAGPEREKIETILEDERDAKIKDLAKRLVELEEEKEQDLQMLRQDNESLRRDYDTIREDRKDLQTQNERLKEHGGKLRERFDELREKDGKSEERNGKLEERNRELKEQNKELKERNEESRRQNEDLKAQNVKLKGEGDNLKRDYDRERRESQSFQAECKRLRQESDETQETLDGQKRHITELTEVISQSGSRMVTTTRDDDYFEAEFTKLVGAIQQWVFRNFRGPSDLRLEHLHGAIRNSLDCTIWTNSGHLKLDFKVKEIQAVVADQLVRHAFYWFPFGKPDVQDIRQGFQAILGHLGGTDLQRRRWHAETVDMINNDPRCAEYYKVGVNRIVKHLKNCLDIRVTGGKEEHRDQALFALVEQAVRLAGEINREVAIFELHGLQLGGPYDPELMEDISGLLGDEGEGERGARGVVVQKLLFPMVLRYKFDDQGQLLKKDPVVVRKATVVVMRPEHFMYDPLD